MDREDIRIVCFGSGDFPVETFEFLAKHGYVVGFVTSNDKPIFGNKRVYDIATEYGIPVCIPKDLESQEFLDWLDNVNGNTFCVISYKFLPRCVVKKAKYAFNIHASLLPLLRGAAPINWAIRYGFTRTGLTAIKLADKIDTGGIISTFGENINDDDNFETLYKRLSEHSVLMVSGIIDLIEEDAFCVYAEQPSIPKSMDNKIFHAPKLNKENTTFSYFGDNDITGEDLHNFIRSLSPNIGATFNMVIRKWVENETDEFGGDFEDVKDITFKVYESELVRKNEQWFDDNFNGSHIITDWKTYLYMVSPSYDNDLISVKKIQLPGKKILEVKDFLKGFQVYNKPEHKFLIY